MLCNALIMHTRPLPSHPHSALLSLPHTRLTSQTDRAGVLSRARFWSRAFLDRAQLNDFTLLFLVGVEN